MERINTIANLITAIINLATAVILYRLATKKYGLGRKPLALPISYSMSKYYATIIYRHQYRCTAYFYCCIHNSSQEKVRRHLDEAENHSA